MHEGGSLPYCVAFVFSAPNDVVSSVLVGAENDMMFFFSQYSIASRRCSCKMLLAFLWVVGFICGCLCAAGADNVASLMRACCVAGVSIVGLFLVPFLPFLITAAAVYFSAPFLVYLTGFCKAFLLGFCVCAVHSGFAEGGWLVSMLLLFTDMLTIPVLFWFQRCAVCNPGKGIIKCGALAFVWFAAVSAVDFFWIVPLLRDII